MAIDAPIVECVFHSPMSVEDAANFSRGLEGLAEDDSEEEEGDEAVRANAERLLLDRERPPTLRSAGPKMPSASIRRLAVAHASASKRLVRPCGEACKRLSERARSRS